MSKAPNSKRMDTPSEGLRRSRGFAVVVWTALLFVAIAPVQQPAEAAFPGRPGRIFFGRGIAGNQDIYSVRPDGTKLQRVTRQRGAELDPNVSPDGRHVAYTCGGTEFAYESGDICVIRPNGRDRQNLTSSEAVEEDPAWSPDGNRLVFVRKVSPDVLDAFPVASRTDTDLFVMNRRGGGVTQLTQGLDRDTTPEWSPSGESIVFGRTTPAGQTDIWVVNVDGTGATNLTPGSPHEASPTWAPDARRILFSRDLGHDRKLFVINPDGSGLHPVDHPGAASDPTWSPNGRRIVFQDVYRSDRVVLFVINSDGERRRLLVPSLSDDNHSADWQPR